MTSLAVVPREESQSAVELPAQETDQALQEQVERKIQELVDLLESNGETFLAKYDPSKDAHSVFHHPTIPPRLPSLHLALQQELGWLVPGEQLPLLHGFLAWYMTEALPVLSPRAQT